MKPYASQEVQNIHKLGDIDDHRPILMSLNIDK